MSAPRFPRWLSLAALVLIEVTLSGCVTLGHASDPIPTQLVPAPQPRDERVLVVVLPGIGSSKDDLARHDVAEAIQRQWPDADTLLTSAALAYYGPEGRLTERLQGEIIEPARDQGYDHIWLIGASLGGLGALLYEQQYPGDVNGVVAFAPFLGGDDLPEQIRAAGGISRWQAQPLPPKEARNPYLLYPLLVFRMARDWLVRPNLAKRIWIVCGRDDNLKSEAELLATALPQAHYVEVDGGHRWSVWLDSLHSTLPRIRNPHSDS